MTPAVDTTDFELLEAMADGDEEALVRFFEKYHGVVYAFAQRRLDNETDAADVLNDVMLEAWRSAGRFQGRARVRTWLLGITHHRIVDRLRRRHRHQADPVDEQVADESAPSGFDAVVLNQHVEEVQRCLDKLADVHRQVIHLTFYEELSYPEIAQVLGAPTGTIKTRMMHAKAKLRDCLQRRLVASGSSTPTQRRP